MHSQENTIEFKLLVDIMVAADFKGSEIISFTNKVKEAELHDISIQKFFELMDVAYVLAIHEAWGHNKEYYQFRAAIIDEIITCGILSQVDQLKAIYRAYIARSEEKICDTNLCLELCFLEKYGCSIPDYFDNKRDGINHYFAYHAATCNSTLMAVEYYSDIVKESPTNKLKSIFKKIYYAG